MFDLPPELADLQLPQYRPSLAPRTPVELPWHDEESWESWLKDPVWLRRAFTADKDHLNSVLMTKPIGDLLSIAYLKSVRNSVHRVGLSYLASFTGPHRCQVAGDKVLMADGSWKNIEDIVIGDKLLSPQMDGRIIKSNVIDISNHVDETYDVLDEDANQLYTCSKDHPIPTFTPSLLPGVGKVSYRPYTAEQISVNQINSGPITTFMAKDGKWASSKASDRLRIHLIKAKPQRVYGFTLDSPSSLYITNDWLVVHNTAKSTSACLFAHIWDPTFWDNFEQRVVQSPYQFMTTMDSIRKDKIIGAAVVVDEAGTTFASGDWYEKWMRSIQKVLQICGLLKPVILFVAPNREFIVSGMRKLIVAEHHMKRFDPRFTRMSCYQVKYNFMKKGDPYIFKRPIIRIAGQNITLKHINIYEPPAWFIDRYKNLTEPEKQSRLDKFSEEVRKNISDQEEEEPDYDQLIEEIWQKKEIYFGSVKRDGTQTIDQTAIEIGFSIKPKHAKYIKERIERRLLENKKQVEDFSLRQQEADAERLAIEKEKRMKRLKSMEADDLAADGTDEQAEQIEDMGDDLEKELSSTDD